MPTARKPPQETNQGGLPTVLMDVDTASIETLVEKDPRKLTDKELNIIVAHTRAHREAWMKEEQNPTGKGGGKKRKLEINLNDLDLGADIEL